MRAEVGALAEAERLGECLGLHARAVRWTRVLASAAVLGVGISWLIRGFLGAATTLVVTAPIALVQGKSSTLFDRRLRRQRVFLFDRALVLADPAGAVRVVRWSDVLMVLHSAKGTAAGVLTLRLGTRFKVVTVGGEVLRFGTEWRDSEVLWRTISQRTAATHFPGVRDALAEGAEVQFGDVVVSAAGVRTPAGSAAWSQTAPVVVTRRGTIRIDTVDGLRPLVAASMDATPNRVLLLAVVKACQKAGSGDDHRTGQGDRSSSGLTRSKVARP